VLPWQDAHFHLPNLLFFQPGLPDGFFLDQKSQFVYILEELRMDNVFIYSGHK
jgi:hypothetical protein